jgi:hypothetical protein
MFLVFTPSVGVKYFWVDLGGRHVFAPTPSVGVVHLWVVCIKMATDTEYPHAHGQYPLGKDTSA